MGQSGDFDAYRTDPDEMICTEASYINLRDYLLSETSPHDALDLETYPCDGKVIVACASFSGDEKMCATVIMEAKNKYPHTIRADAYASVFYYYSSRCSKIKPRFVRTAVCVL